MAGMTTGYVNGFLTLTVLEQGAPREVAVNLSLLAWVDWRAGEFGEIQCEPAGHWFLGDAASRDVLKAAIKGGARD